VLDEHTFDGFDVAWTRTVRAPGRETLTERFYTHYEPLGRRVARGVAPTDSTTTSTGPDGTGPSTSGPDGPTSSGPTGPTVPGETTTTTTEPPAGGPPAATTTSVPRVT
jgi:hypothetical protein